MTNKTKRVLDLAEAAIKLPAEERSRFLRDACGKDESLLKEVETLLATDTDQLPFLDGRATDLLRDTGSLPSGTQVGAFQIVELVGRGGMGEVYLASRIEGDFEEHVAVKVLRPGLESSEFAIRFRTERQILANLRHPNIATILDGGTTKDHRSYFAMELIEGKPIDQYCNEHQLSIRDRLLLFQKVCVAVQFAHRNLIVHRDLKPSNILITSEGEPKLLDFGVAKLMDPMDEDTTTLGGISGLTPEYASPEQILGEVITTASDVYSLGVVLYELLTGSRPYHFESRRNPQHILKVLEETQPSEPSSITGKGTRYRDEEEEKRVRRTLKGDLDHILLRCIERDRNQRYNSVAEVVEDINNYLWKLPINIAPKSYIYRLKKFFSRHRTALAVTAALLLIVSVSLSSFMSRNAERKKATQLQSFLVRVFADANPTNSGGRNLSLQDVLKSASDRLEEELEDQPEARSELLGQLSTVLYQQGNFASAEDLARRSVEIRTKSKGEDSLSAAEAKGVLGTILIKRGEYQEAEQLLRFSLARQLSSYGRYHEEISSTYTNLTTLMIELGRYAEAEKYQREALNIDSNLFEGDHPYIGNDLNGLGVILHRNGRFPEAETAFKRALEIRQKGHGEVSSQVGNTLINLASLYRSMGLYDRSEEHYKRAIQIQQKVYGDKHHIVAIALNNLATMLYQKGNSQDLERVEQLHRQALEIRRMTYGDRHPEVAKSLEALAIILKDQENFEQAELLYEETLQIWREHVGEEHEAFATSLFNFGVFKVAIGDHPSAEKLILRAIETLGRLHSPEHLKLAGPYFHLGKLRKDQERYSEAESYLRQSLDIRTKHGGAESWQTGIIETVLGQTLVARGHAAEGHHLLKSGLKKVEKDLGSEHKSTSKAREALVEYYRATGQEELAQDLHNKDDGKT